jgi:hypothetical protein
MARPSLDALIQRYIATLKLLQCVLAFSASPSLTYRASILTRRYQTPLPPFILAPLQRTPRAPRSHTHSIILQSRRAHIPTGIIAARLRSLFARRMGLIPPTAGQRPDTRERG